ncbi:GNAT family N-acetyltransferase [Thalassotalea sp. G2M2-11]|uniref:GNAT family N-acetyltransferase n=1 Tax=Thalassotalea sp. G2M2-11 TaxID=2787627 RepID=UPI0019D24646|nr:GNAT family N-acetyltransferase [Thalassotalea sp. G2M2-11]
MQTYKEAAIEESDLLTSLVRRAKAHWGYPQEWMEEWKEELTISPSYIASNIVVVLESDKKIVGFFGLELKDGFAYLGHLWIEPSHIGTGLGKLLFAKVCKEALNRGYSTMELVADPNAEGFYRRYGATKIDEVHGSILGTPRVLPRLRLNLKSTNKSLNNDAEKRAF